MGVGKTTTGKILCEMLGRTAFIDGDWCIDIHPFIGNKETKEMAINNIIHMTRNYYNCSECENIVLSWVMSENSINRIISELSNLEVKIHVITLICDKESLIDRWNKDLTTEWRIDEWLQQSIESLEDYSCRAGTILINTSNTPLCDVADEIFEALI